MRSQGLTLIEFLVALVVVGIVVAMFGDSYVKSIRRAELREAAAQLAADFRGARAQAQRRSSDRVVSWAPGVKTAAYSVNGVSFTLPNHVTFECVSGCDATAAGNRVTYLSPYGELSTAGGTANGKILRLSSPLASIPPLDLRTVGVTGKVLVASTP